MSRTADSIGKRSLAVDLNAGTLSCRYDIRGASMNAASDHRVLTIEIGNAGAGLSLWNGGLDRSFSSVDDLSAFLLAPILGDA